MSRLTPSHQSGTTSRGGGAAIDETLRIWRPRGAHETLCMHGVTRAYAIDPIGECVFGLLLAGAMEARRGRTRTVFGPGDLCVWSPSGRHSGRPHRYGHWEARLIIVPLSAIEDLAVDADGAPGVRFREPRIDDKVLAARFLHLHRALERPMSALEVEGRLVEWATGLLGPPAHQAVTAARARRDPALRRARELLSDDPSANITLAQLARAAGASRHRLSRLFRAAHGLPPHRFQLARRLEAARGLLEHGRTIVDAASVSGFFDQSHLHRHFRRAFGLAPARYVALLRSTVQDDAGSAS